MNIIFILTISIFYTFSAFSNVILKDVGVIGLASHDMFSWDRKNERNTENGRLDLSTIFDYENGKRWHKGGDPKNGENAPVWSVTKRIVNFYKKKLNQYKNSPNQKELARKESVKEFHRMIIDSYTRLSGLEFPTEAYDLKVNNTEQAVLRAFHDILPGRVKTYRGRFFPIKTFALTNFIYAKFYLNDKELNQKIKYFDGDYDYEYQNIKIPFTSKIINLKEVDRKFIEKFSEYKQEDMLSELKEVGLGNLNINEVSFIHHVKELFQKGICSKNSKWIPNNIPCN